MDLARLERLCTALQQEPLLHLSLHSKELFHSNFLGWLCETHPGEMRAELERWVPARPGEVLEVLRERGQLDLAVRLPGLAPFVVENKVFAPPDETQLDRYAEGGLAGFDDPTLLLLSLGRPAWPNDEYRTPNGLVWRYLSFDDLASVVRSVAERLASSSAPAFEQLLARHYSEFVQALTALVDEAGRLGPDDPIVLPHGAATLLRGIRLHDGVTKLRARSATASARARTEGALADHNVRWGAGYTNAMPLVEAFVELANHDWIGWQYQGGQWRLAVICDQNVGRGAELRARRHAYVARKYLDWFDFEAVPVLIDRNVDAVPPTEADGRFNNYDPGFVYRYRKIPDLTTAELCELSDHFLRRAAAWRWP